MPITKQIQRTITKIVIRWERDYDATIIRIDPTAIFFVSDNNIEVQETFEALVSKDEYTIDESRQRTAELIEITKKWRDDKWFFLGCSVTAIAEDQDVDGNIESTEEVCWTYVGGMESYSGEEFQKETETKQISELRSELNNIGYTISDEDWNNIPVIQDEDSCYLPTDSDPSDDVTPLAVLPANDNNTSYRYADYDDDGFEEGNIIATCKHCDEHLTLDHINDGSYHPADCPRFDSQGVYINEIN